MVSGPTKWKIDVTTMYVITASLSFLFLFLFLLPFVSFQLLHFTSQMTILLFCQANNQRWPIIPTEGRVRLIAADWLEKLAINAIWLEFTLHSNVFSTVLDYSFGNNQITGQPNGLEKSCNCQGKVVMNARKIDENKQLLHNTLIKQWWSSAAGVILDHSLTNWQYPQKK